MAMNFVTFNQDYSYLAVGMWIYQAFDAFLHFHALHLTRPSADRIDSNYQGIPDIHN